ncbi:MAG: hypothetical protein ACXQS8_06005 [Candidatus Helarchaeales archaeon]
MGHQLFEFANRKGAYYEELAEHHLKSREPKKAKELLLGAVQWYRKGGNEEKAKECQQKADSIKL